MQMLWQTTTLPPWSTVLQTIIISRFWLDLGRRLARLPALLVPARLVSHAPPRLTVRPSTCPVAIFTILLSYIDYYDHTASVAVTDTAQLRRLHPSLNPVLKTVHWFEHL